MNWLEIISKDHAKWISFVNSFGEKQYAEDIVQDMYLKLHKMDTAVRNNEDKRFAENYSTESRVLKDGKPNSSYIWMVLNSVFLDYKKAETKENKISLNDIQLIYEQDESIEQEWQNFNNKLEQEKQGWHKYDKMLFDVYSKNKISMRDIASGTGIELRSIWNTINNCKLRIKKLEKEYKQIQNGQ